MDKSEVVEALTPVSALTRHTFPPPLKRMAPTSKRVTATLQEHNPSFRLVKVLFLSDKTTILFTTIPYSNLS